MAIFHYTVKIVGRSKGKSVISASAYLNGDVMKNEETGRISYYTSKKEVVYTSLMMCENAPPEWQIVPEENIKRFQKSVRYKRSEDKEAALEKFKITFQKQRLWNEVLKIEKNADAQLGRSFEFALPKEWNRQEQIQYTTDYIQKTFVDRGMCADWSIHDKGDGNPHVHLLLTMRPFNPDHSWGKKEVKDWDFLRDKNGNIVLHEGDKCLMVLRPYQFYAVEKILDRVQNSNDNGYIWHTTGAGKTLTSFKAAQLVSELDDVDKVMFVVDRHDLDTQTQSEYEAFEPGAVDSTDNTDELVKRLQSNSKIIITTIQKLNAAVSKTWYQNQQPPQ